MQSHFDNELFDFLTQLQANNNREWFAEHKERYERHVKQPLLDFIEDFEPHLHSISKHFVADTPATGGSAGAAEGRSPEASDSTAPATGPASASVRTGAGGGVLLMRTRVPPRRISTVSTPLSSTARMRRSTNSASIMTSPGSGTCPPCDPP